MKSRPELKKGSCPSQGQILVKLGWLGGAMVLGELPVLGRPTDLDYSRAGACCACSGCGWGLFGLFFLSAIIPFFFFPLSGRRPDID